MNKQITSHIYAQLSLSLSSPPPPHNTTWLHLLTLSVGSSIELTILSKQLGLTSSHSFPPASTRGPNLVAKLGGGMGRRHLRGKGIQATGFHFEQAVPPVFPGHTEIVYGSPKNLKGGVLQQEVWAFCSKSQAPILEP